MKRISIQHERHTRHGLLTPFIAVAILVVGAAMALVIDHIWLGSVHSQLRSAAEASALAGARQLISDLDLVAPPTTEYELDRRDDLIQHTAANIALMNPIAGTPLELITGPEGDIHIGKQVYNEASEGTMFLEHRYNPTSVVVSAERSHHRRNPVALFMDQLAGHQSVDMQVYAEATIDNRLISLKPTATLNIPALPFAVEVKPSVLAHDYTSQFLKLGQNDELSYDESKKAIVQTADGLSELVLEFPYWSVASSEPSDTERLWGMVLDFNSHCETKTLLAQIENGLTTNDLAQLDGTLSLGYDSSTHLIGEPAIDRDVADALPALIGQTRVLFLHSTELGDPPKTQTLNIVEAVCVRVMNVELDDDTLKLTLQPAVMTTKTAQLTDVPIYHAHPEDYRNPTIYNLSLSH